MLEKQVFWNTTRDQGDIYSNGSRMYCEGDRVFYEHFSFDAKITDNTLTVANFH
ncbi:MAG TPA: hypothetical protein HA230_03715 [Candidatus Aenigmarchaeota archaeon]|nr:hypothetical protein [Candidatus Aenigmarchaeota archaeon]